MAKLFHCLSVIAIAGAAVAGSPKSTAAGNLPPRIGKSDFPTAEPQCWSPNGPTVTNICNQDKFWYMPLVSSPAGAFTVTVNAFAPINSNVTCISTTADREGVIRFQSGTIQVPQLNIAADINLPVIVPSGGTGMVDCRVSPGGRLNSLSW